MPDSVPVKLVLGGTVAYKVYGRYSKSNDSNTNSQPTFSLMPNTDPDIETLSPEPNTKLPKSGRGERGTDQANQDSK